jgi:hypothetical protein
LAEALCSDESTRAADEVRRHLDVGMQHAMEVLQPYFKLRKATGRTFYRSDRRLRHGPLELSQLN